MSRVVYVNGDFVREKEAKVSVFDRGFLFGDGVYEVCSVLDGKLIDKDAHLARLGRSLESLKMNCPASLEDITSIQRELIAKNGIVEGTIYLQVTRGVADRDFNFPNSVTPSLVIFTQKKNLLNDPIAGKGISVITLPDIRWRRRDIKTVMLLPASLAKQEALERGAGDAWLVEDGYVTEGSANNAYIVTMGGVIVTRQLTHSILHGITRKAVLKLAEQDGYEVEERAFTPGEACEAAEAFITSASSFVTPVVKINDRVLCNGIPGPVTSKLRRLYIEMARAEAE
ncbi:D-amino-acid transaminase [Pelagibius litoralis]|uniref:D-amino-acid transaminase n=1 Tax=Pelagibius litoralis TaxID=374515 RepID=UPI002AC32997|nr:D-amino-acid transaminase [Pelagibius litoralis]